MVKLSITGFLVCLFILPAKEAVAVDFNQEIRPILSNACFRCHGPDEAERKADLRLDSRDGAIRDLGGYAAIVPGKPDASHLLKRIHSHDPDDRMPPPNTTKRLSASEMAVLERWIKEGAPYAKHWAYVPPTPVTPPEVRNPKLVRNDIDRFVLKRLDKEGLAPSPEANRHVLARRVALDLTGLPPTPEEVDRFVDSDSPNAYAELVNGLLRKQIFGEHWARHWLDLARYADSTGYADDPPRTIWAFRDYVIRSFNENKPFDQFTREQLAGDLLPNPTQDQLIATAFHRNTQTNNEGGTNDEEFRNVAVVDRVSTTFSVWMGTTMGCAQCHTHKFDPITHHEYFGAFAIFNNSADADRRDESPTIEVTTTEFDQKTAEKRAELARLEKALETPSKAHQEPFEKWQDQMRSQEMDWKVLQPAELEGQERQLTPDEKGFIKASDSAAATDVYTITTSTPKDQDITAIRLEVIPDGQNAVLNEIAVKASSHAPDPIHGQFVRIELKGKRKIIHVAEVEVFSGGKNVARQGKASQVSTYADAVASRAIDGKTDGDYHKQSVSHTADGQNDPWWEVDLGQEYALDRVALWNRTDGVIGSRLDGFTMTVLDTKRQPLWSQTFEKAPEVDLTVPLDGSRTLMLGAPSATFSQKEFDVEKAIDGKTSKDSGWAFAPALDQTHAAVFQFAKPIKASTLTFTLFQTYPNRPLRHFRLAVTSEALPVRLIPARLRAILNKKAADRSAKEAKRLFAYYARFEPSLKGQREAKERLANELAAMKPPTTVPVMRELPRDKQRKTHIQIRGNYLAKGDLVKPGLPNDLHRAPDTEKEPTRLDLAEWLMDPSNPLTARVTANRFWEAIFGYGLVRTSEEFGSQGEPPTHPELLDWLANELVASEWDIKAFLKQLVTSGAYRQSSKVTPELLERDPDNRLFARGPRFRLSAEMVRDQALFVSGLLSDKMYGKPVQPRQPNIGLSAAFGGGIDWKTSSGDDQYRRGLYTMWRRSNPYPSMAAFDAPSREVCTVRRDRTNTPLQALVTLNDPVYMEAAQALARDLLALGKSPADTIEMAFRRSLVRPPQDKERAALVKLFQETQARLAKEPKRAEQLATDPLGPVPEETDVIALASWSVVSNVILNLDEIFLKP